MQPTNNSRPVMDVTAPTHPPAPQASERTPVALPVREAPTRPEDVAYNPPQQAAETPASDSSPSTSADNPQPDKPVETTPTMSKQPSDKPPTPVGAVVAAIFGMLVLAGAAVLVYLKS